MIKRILYIDPIGGIAGDMLCAALLDAGLNQESWLKGLSEIPWSESVNLTVSKVMRHSFSATHFAVQTSHHHHSEHSHFVGTKPVEDTHHHRGMLEIRELIQQSQLPEDVQTNAIKVFELLGNAEAEIHGTTLEQIHFHEVGAIDSIIDILGFCFGLYLLKIDQLVIGAIPLSSGEIITAHGRTPLPAPATLRIMKNWQTKVGHHNHEQVTPTGAALVKALGEYGHFPPMNIEVDGFGAGTRDPSEYPNLVRVCIGTFKSSQSEESIIEIQCNIDDMSGELLSPLIERLLNIGALDAHFQSITMKKGRQGQLCTVLCTENTLDAVTNCIFKHTSTFGFRMSRKERRILDRQFDIVQTERGPVNIKVGLLRNAVVQISVEFKDAQIIANQHDLSVQEVFQFSLAQHRHQFPHRYSKTEEA